MAATNVNIDGAQGKISQKLTNVQPIPRATDLDSALKAIQAITNNLNTSSGATGTSPANTSSAVQAAAFLEDKSFRLTQTVRIFNPADNTQYVDVVQITQMLFRDPNGNTLFWKL